MNASNPHRSPKPRKTIRKDGWTAERQMHFLDSLGRTRSVTKASAAAGMTRESAYRLRDRCEGALFAALWDRMLEPRNEVHIPPLTNGRLMRLLGNHYRRESGDFVRIAQAMQRGRAANRK